MQDVILLVSTSAIFVFGYFLMNKLDALSRLPRIKSHK